MNTDEQAIEIIEKNRRISLIGFIVTFTCWQLGQIVTLNFGDSASPLVLGIFHFLNIAGSFGWVGFSYYLYKSIRLQKQHPQIKDQINDERASLIRLRAMSFGFVYSTGAAGLIFGTSFLIDSFAVEFRLQGTVVAQSIMLIGLVSSWVAYLILDKEE